MSAPARRLTVAQPLSVASQDPLTVANDCGPNVARFPGRQSSEIGFGQMSRAGRRRRDPLQCYAAFPERWQAFLRAMFADAAEVAGFFRVTPKAAEKWWAGIGGAQGAKVAYALDEIEGAADWLLDRRVAG